MATLIDNEFVTVTVSVLGSSETYSQVIPKEALAEFVFRSGFEPGTFRKSITVKDSSNNVIREIRY